MRHFGGGVELDVHTQRVQAGHGGGVKVHAVIQQTTHRHAALHSSRQGSLHLRHDAVIVAFQLDELNGLRRAMDQAQQGRQIVAVHHWRDRLPRSSGCAPGQQLRRQRQQARAKQMVS